MVALSRNRMVRLPVTALLLAVGFFVSPDRASAECGDYVTIAGKPSAHHAMPSAPADDAKPTDAPRTPCNGPNCSKRQDSPVAPVRAPATPTGEAKPIGVALGADLPPDADSGAWLTIMTSVRPVRTATSIFHPPRSV
jgi:hypothetical protein